MTGGGGGFRGNGVAGTVDGADTPVLLYRERGRKRVFALVFCVK